MVRKSTFKICYKTKHSYFLIQNILYFVTKSVKCILWQIFNEIVDNQDLYRNKDDYQYVICIIIIIYYSVYKVDYRERTAPKGTKKEN